METKFTDTIIAKIFQYGEPESWQPSEKIPLIVKEIEHLKAEMKVYLIKDCGFDMDELSKESHELSQESKMLIAEMEMCEQEIEEVTMAEILKSLQKHDVIARELERVKFSLNVVYDVVQSGKYFQEYEEHERSNRFCGSVEALTDLTNFLNSPAEGFKALDIYSNLKDAVVEHWEFLLQDLTAEWDKLLSCSTEVTERQINISINITCEESPATYDVLEALANCKQLHIKISTFANYFLKNVLVPIILQECTVYEESDELLTVNMPFRNPTKPNYDVVILNLRLLFHFLSKRLKLEVNNNDTLMSLIGKEICHEFKDIIIKECLLDTIPSVLSGIHEYGRVIAEIEEFQVLMRRIRFFPQENFSILQYTDNLDELFANKTSQYFLESARVIMLKDLSSMMSIGVESVPNDTEEDPLDESLEEALKIFSSTIPKSLFYFPRCMISKTAQELLDLVFTMMEQAVQSSDLVWKRLYTTTRFVFELYDAVVPYHHENYLQTIPQYVALFHNNCMYLAHNLLTLGEKWTMMDQRTSSCHVSFLDLVQKMRNLGYKHLTVHMQQQRKQILDNIRSSDLNCIVMKDVLSDNAEQAIRQCLRQLQVLKNVWVGVFPPNVFTKLMATLVNMFVEEIIHRVCTVEDISAQMATQLTEIYSIVVKRTPNLFIKEADVTIYVKSWIKLQELILVLGGRLKDIEKRWDDGKGPLAVHFRTEELRSLIKALFQNTELRANVLSKIK